MKYSLYDPRRGDDLRIVDHPTGYHFSSRSHGLFAVQGVGQQIWFEKPALLTRAVEATGLVGFVAVEPWVPTQPELRSVLSVEAVDLGDIGGLIYGTLQLSHGAIGRALALWNQMGRCDSGTWHFGSWADDVAQIEGSDTIRGLQHASKFGCRLTLDEMDQYLFLSRIFPDLDVLVAEMF